MEIFHKGNFPKGLRRVFVPLSNRNLFSWYDVLRRSYGIKVIAKNCRFHRAIFLYTRNLNLIIIDWGLWRNKYIMDIHSKKLKLLILKISYSNFNRNLENRIRPLTKFETLFVRAYPWTRSQSIMKPDSRSRIWTGLSMARKRRGL